jgi:hypothetical protein
MTISISGQVPAKAQNGMYELEALWNDERTPEPVYAVVKIERDGVKFKDADQQWSATMKLAHIEPMTDEVSIATARQLLDEAAFERGGAVLASDVELDIPVDGSSVDASGDGVRSDDEAPAG